MLGLIADPEKLLARRAHLTDGRAGKRSEPDSLACTAVQIR
jgi:hypothetical protein